MAKVILKRIWRSGIVSVAVLVGLGSVGSGNVNARSHQPETKVMALMPAASSQQLDRTLTAASEATSGNVYSQFRRGTSNPGVQPPANQPASGGNQKVFQAKIKRRAGGTPVIDVVFNGNKTFEMIVDTGASGTLITQRMAAALGVRRVGTARAGIADGSIVEFPIGVVRSIRVGGAAIQNVEVAIAKQMEIGLLGHDFFGNYDVKIKKDVVEFYVR
ncbi:MAG: retroviral-like aspartic protease family protein [Microcoleus sp. PH2017_10_PVI_O_A]|nr:retroviral-like aspartic protease family protein [Microcoleus sp. PH2017_10_PVI_O_A]MCC3460866.1 retroviral-like aspartic protease family protein [Microcoleus sp. PH2017_11_PCY_U_A]MCC3478175.1 retroviral-like aspartic protease family protein [Microcoleus sp. PH2017_12_PCY_D_A]MCC3527358.1 retroviral-like aspartic protease family protein [Microcoleus sp. PH2017_21_RUC_O_A]MCC3539449.1 retroviral-like aspartic protease family protein [Microcoleus sp. PH2017_22_RUC_O_B]MCC3559048.1 retroviral